MLIRLLSYSGAGGDAVGQRHSAGDQSYGDGGGGRSCDQQTGGGKGLVVARITREVDSPMRTVVVAHATSKAKHRGKSTV